MKRKKNNNLILVNVGADEKHYFTSANRAGQFLGIQQNSVNWAIVHGNTLINNNDKEVTIELVDGSEIPYKYINI